MINTMGQENQLTHEPVNSRTPELAAVLRAMFAILNKSDVNYCVLRNYEELPDYTGHDIDILVARPHLETALAALRQAYRRHGWNLLAEITQTGNHSLYLYHEYSAQVQFLTIDVVVELTWGWMPTCDASRVLATKSDFRGIPVAAPGTDAALRVLKTVLRGQLPNEKAWASIRKFTSAQPHLFREVLDGYGHADISHKMIAAIDAGDLEQLGRLGQELRGSVFRHANLRRPLATVRNFTAYLVDRARRRWGRGLGMMVVLIGPDGIGKTALVTRLSSRIGKLLFRGTKNYHCCFNIMPRLNRLLHKTTGVQVREIDFTKKHSGSNVKPHSTLRSLIYLIYYSLDYLLGRWKIRSLKAKDRLVLFDRYFYDHYFQRRSGNLPHWLIKLFQRLAPKPDVVLVLKADPAVVYRRKPELTEEDIRRGIENAERVGDSLTAITSVQTIRTDQGEEIAEDQAARAILRALRKRNYGDVVTPSLPKHFQPIKNKGELICK